MGRKAISAVANGSNQPIKNHREKKQHQPNPQKPQLFGNHRKNKVGLTGGNKLELTLRTKAQSATKQPPGTNRDDRLTDLVATIVRIGLRIKKSQNPVALVIGKQEKPRDEKRDNRHQHNRR